MIDGWRDEEGKRRKRGEEESRIIVGKVGRKQVKGKGQEGITGRIRRRAR